MKVAVCFLSALLFLLASNEPAIAQITKITGYVYDLDGKPVGGVVVGIFPLDKRGDQKQVATNDKGYYETSVKKGFSFDIAYAHSSVGLISLNRLSGDQNQSISKVLCRDLREAGPRAGGFVLEQLQGIENAMFRRKFGENEEELSTFLDKFQVSARLGTIEGDIEANVPPGGAEAQVLTLKAAFIKKNFDPR